MCPLHVHWRCWSSLVNRRVERSRAQTYCNTTTPRSFQTFNVTGLRLLVKRSSICHGLDGDGDKSVNTNVKDCSNSSCLSGIIHPYEHTLFKVLPLLPGDKSMTVSKRRQKPLAPRDPRDDPRTASFLYKSLISNQRLTALHYGATVPRIGTVILSVERRRPLERARNRGWHFHLRAISRNQPRC